MWVRLSDGRVIGVPLAWFPRLMKAGPAAREAVEISPFGLHREALDEDVPVEGLLAGRGDQRLAGGRGGLRGSGGWIARPALAILPAMTLEELADLIRANSANTNGRIDRLDGRVDALRNETNAQLVNIQNDLTDVKRSLDLIPTVSNLQKQIDSLAAEVAALRKPA